VDAAAFCADPALAPWVRSMHAYDLDGFAPGEHIGLPSATVVLVIPTEPLLDLSMAGERRVMGSCVSGLHDGPVAIHHDGTQRGIQVELEPLGVAGLFGVPAGSLAHTAVRLDDILGRDEALRWLDTIKGAGDWPGRLSALQDGLLRRLERGDRTPTVRPEVRRAWSLVEGSGGSIRISQVANDVGWSTRHLTQQFTSATGLTPKSFARIVRFQRSVSLVARRTSLAEAAVRTGYADQAHLTREWARLAGTTPGRWPRQDALANVQDRRRSGPPG